MLNEVGSPLKETRRRLKMPHRQFREKLGVNGSTVAEHENGITYAFGDQKPFREKVSL